tara:strand:- start:4601 stop:5014 length:414 start_codon:yes stop_codon:yes gene_type:complete
MQNKETNTDPIPSNEGDYLKLANELKSQFDEEKAKWEAKFIVLEKQNKEMRNFIKKINNVTDEIVKSNNKRIFEEIDNNSEGSSEPPRRRRRRRRGVSISRRDGGTITEGERQFLRFMIQHIEQQTTPTESVQESNN